MLRLVTVVSLIVAVKCVPIDPITARQRILDAEQRQSTGGHAFLTAKESRADDILMGLKNQMTTSGSSRAYPPGMHFFLAKPLIETSPMFRVLKAMPKGSVLHLHSGAAVSSSWIIQNLTYRTEAKLCEVDGKVFFVVRPTKICPEDALKNIQKLRADNGSRESFDTWLESQINLKLRDPDLMHTDVNHVWDEFQLMFDTVKELISYRPFFEAFHAQMLAEFFEDNVQYIEVRTSLGKLYDLKGVEYDEVEVAKIITAVNEAFKRDHPGFVGLKVIYAKHRGVDNGTVQDLLRMFVKLNKQFPDLVIGFDLVGQEDINNPLSAFLDELRQFKSTTPYFFHAGETNGYGSDADMNLLDAVLLNSRRIGHGYSLYKHPVLWKLAKAHGIALEVCPLSNQVLRLVNDLRNHPAVFYVSESVPLVISSDDPGFWDAQGVSFDFYYAFMAIAPHSAGIGFLKQIVWDSVRYSTLTPEERTEFAEKLQIRWDQFLDDLIAGKLLKN